MSLLESQRYNTIFVIVNWYSKLIYMVPTMGTAKLFLSAWWKHYGLPKVIVSNQGPNFISRFWRHFFKMVRTKLTFSTSLHLQTNRQTKRVNRVSNQYLRNFVSANQRDGTYYVSLMEFNFNATTHMATKQSPFKVAYGVDLHGIFEEIGTLKVAKICMHQVLHKSSNCGEMQIFVHVP